MDRMNEFLVIVQSTGIYQKKYDELDKTSSITYICKEINDLLVKLESLSLYESFKMQRLEEDIRQKINKLKNIEIIDETGIEQEYYNKIKEFRQKNIQKYNLRLNKATRKHKTYLEEVEQKRENYNSKQSLLLYENEVKQDYLLEKRRLANKMEEVGSMVEEFSIQISLHDEKIKRIDEITKESSNWLKKALNELKSTWSISRGNKKIIFIFFGFWSFVIIIFWLLKKV